MSNGCFWIAIQSNQLKDTGIGLGQNSKIGHNWKDMITETVDGLKKAFYIPKLFRNFRNSEEICDLTESVKGNSRMPGFDLMNIFDDKTESMSIHSMKPRWIRIYRNALKKYLGEALRNATQLIRKEDNNSEGSIVILYDDSYFYQLSSQQIYDFYKSCVDSEEQVFRYTTREYFSNNHSSLKPILEFINTPKSCLLTKDELFSGCETENMIFITQGDYSSSYRSNLTRCISNLCVIEIIGEGEYHSFEKALPINDFLECLDECSLQIYQCKTCTNDSTTSEPNDSKTSVFNGAGSELINLIQQFQTEMVAISAPLKSLTDMPGHQEMCQELNKVVTAMGQSSNYDIYSNLFDEKPDLSENAFYICRPCQIKCHSESHKFLYCIVQDDLKVKVKQCMCKVCK